MKTQQLLILIASVVILDADNPSILIENITFDIWPGPDTDLQVGDYLSAIEPNLIVVMAVYDTVVLHVNSQTVSVLNS